MQKGSALIPLTLFLAVIVLAVVSGWYYVNNQPQSEPPPKTPYMPTMSVDNPEPNPDIYENPGLGFKFKYPAEYDVTEETEEEFHERSNGDMRKNFNSTLFYPPAEFVTSLYIAKPGEDLKNAALSIWVFENPDNLTPEGFYKKYWYYPFIWGDFTSAKEKIAPREEFELGDATASSGVAEYQTNHPRFAYLQKDGLMYLLKTNGDDQFLKRIIFD